MFYSNKKKIHGLKYQVIVRINDGQIIHVSKGYPCSVHDKKLWDCWLNDYKDELLSSEVVAADKGYQGAL